MKKVGLICSLAILVFAVSCGHPMTLMSISVSPSTQTVTGAGSSLANFPTKFTAYGNFMHPQEMVDISSQVIWTSSTPLVATVDNVGHVTATGNGSCGTVMITATANKGVVGPGTSDVIIVGTATFKVVDTNNTNCP